MRTDAGHDILYTGNLRAVFQQDMPGLRGQLQHLGEIFLSFHGAKLHKK